MAEFTAQQMQTLADELHKDPQGLGYASRVIKQDGLPDRLDDEAACKLLTARQRTVDRETITAGDVFAAITLSDWTSLAEISPVRAWLDRLMKVPGEIPLTNHLRQTLWDAFANGTGSRQNLRQMVRRTGSRAEELGLSGVNESNIAEARKLTPTP